MALTIWAKLRDILEPKLAPSAKVGHFDSYMACIITLLTWHQSGSRPSKSTTESKNLGPSRQFDHNNDVPPEHIIAEFQARQASPAYQEMLVSVLADNTRTQV